ncbi:hypothetical protein [Paraburkholderia aromaticivorans]|uniref:Uncharacterized protein n=1 Tax=Paraburkholderia aromaticivorans TaxID=2026199 RepID=A0A248VTG4_9BURK|nr:hypothetical protein [Paraburkholderia aromaticivorans]ASW02175.1 hypothetical protein CJU94_29140 [Paraburkholderia aromaticivorans]
MNRPLALIEGDLALPIARPFDTLPPPFGSRRRPARVAGQRELQPAARVNAQQAIQNAAQRSELAARNGSLPPGVKFLLFYKLPQPREHSPRFDEQLAEARYYLEMGRARPCSTRSDHVLGAAIFAGCGIALAWLLATCTTHDAAKVTATALTQPVVVRQPVEFAGTIAQTEPPAVNSEPKAASEVPTPTNTTPGTTFGHVRMPEPQRVEHLAPRPVTRASTHQTVQNRSAKADRPVPIVRFSKAQVEGRLALSRTIRPATQPSASRSPEWAAGRSSASDAAERAALFDWAVQQRRAAIITHADLPTPVDTDWSARMTQRRITDNPNAFQSGRSTK